MTLDNSEKLKILQQELKATKARVADLESQIISLRCTLLLEEEKEPQIALSCKEKTPRIDYIPPIAGTSFKLVLNYLEVNDIHMCAQVCKQWTNEIDHEVSRQVISNMIHRVAYSKDEKEARHALFEMTRPIRSSRIITKKKSEEYSKLIFELHGVGAIVGAAGMYRGNKVIQANAFGILANLSSYSNEIRIMMAKSGVPKLAVESALKQYNGEFHEHLNVRVSVLIRNIAYSSEEAARNEMIDFMTQTMVRFPHCKYIQANCCQYFVHVSCNKVPKVQHQLREKDVGSLVKKAFERFPSKDTDCRIKKAMERFLDYM